jgi:predicted unusual protein kinase regulating ubiquinone biosynthesis (AarF/ABC1/UbiB family)
MNTSIPAERVRLVYYDFGQAAELEQNQADGILDIIEAIVDMDVDRSIEAFQEMKVLKENADLEAVRAKVEDNYRTGKVKANIKRLKKRGYEFQTPSNTGLNANSTRVVGSHSQENETVRDTKVMQYFSLPAEYAFVARALTQMDGCGKSLDPEFDFVTSAAPWIYEIKGAGKYLQEEALKWIRNLRKRTCDFLQSVTVAVEK